MAIDERFERRQLAARGSPYEVSVVGLLHGEGQIRVMTA
jgi:hypothetical protein